MSIIKQNVSRIMNLVASSCNQVHRLSTEVCPIVVTKNRRSRRGSRDVWFRFRHFAENRVEKLLERQEQFPQEDIIWHLIGPLQKRKVKQVINRIDLFPCHWSSLRLWMRLINASSNPLDCLLEINVSGKSRNMDFHPKRHWCISKKQTIWEDSYCWFDDDGTIWRKRWRNSLLFSRLAQMAKTIEERRKYSSYRSTSVWGWVETFQAAIECGATHIRMVQAGLKGRKINGIHE